MAQYQLGGQENGYETICVTSDHQNNLDTGEQALHHNGLVYVKPPAKYRCCYPFGDFCYEPEICTDGYNLDGGQGSLSETAYICTGKGK